jgi:dipeptidyl aminopeptidase/acylaminoacyl peptidase
MKSRHIVFPRHLTAIFFVLVLGVMFFSCGVYAAESPVEDKVLPFLKTHKFGDIKISPTGEYLAVTVPLSDRTSLAILDRKTMSLKGHVTFPAGIHVYSFEWVNDTWIIYSIAEQFGSRVAPSLTGELYSVHFTGGTKSYGANGKEPMIGARAFRYNRDSVREVSAEIFDTLPDSNESILISVSPWNDEFSQIERINIYDATRTVLWKVPIRNAQCKANPSKSILVCKGKDNKNNSRMLISRDDKKNWQVLNDQSLSHQSIIPVGFKNEKQLYVRMDQPQGPDEIHLMDVDTGEKKLVSRDSLVDPLRILYSPKTFEPYAVVYGSGKPWVEYLEPENEYALLHKKLQASFTDAIVLPGEATSDLSSSIFVVHSDRIPSDFYFYDQKKNNAQFMVSVAPWLDPNKMAVMEPIKFEARDKTLITGLLTKSRDLKEKQMPLILMPHGGPYGVFDNWEYNEEVQLLAAHGFAVLQVNFRGSGGRGRQFEEMGYQNWGLAMQDDLTDATRWAISEGVADPKKICIYGASYGGYAALMGAAKEPGLYQCAVGYIGVYDLPLILKKGDIAKNKYTAMELTEHMGTAGLEAVSPVNLADRIKIPVMLVAGNIDWRAPPIHTSKMCDALKKTGGKPECYFYNGEGHGFVGGYAREDFYRKLVKFFQTNLSVKSN